MRTILEDLYYGNITPNEQQMTPGSELKRAVDRVAKYENQLMEQLKETEQETLVHYLTSENLNVMDFQTSVEAHGTGGSRRIST